MLYGASPSELAAQQQSYDRYYTGAAEGNRAAALNAALANIANFQRAQQEDDAARAQQRQEQINLAHYQIQSEAQRRQEAAQQAATAEGIREFNVTDARKGAEFASNLDLAKLDLASRGDAKNVKGLAASRTGVNWGAFANADEAAKAGVVTPENKDHVESWIASDRQQMLNQAIDSLNAKAAQTQAKKAAAFVAAMAKAGTPATDEAVSAATKLNPFDVEALKTSVGRLGEQLEFDPETARFKILKAPAAKRDFTAYIGPEVQTYAPPIIGSNAVASAWPVDEATQTATQPAPGPGAPVTSLPWGAYNPSQTWNGAFQPGKLLTPELARAYRQKFGNKADAEKAAIADGYTWNE